MTETKNDSGILPTGNNDAGVQSVRFSNLADSAVYFIVPYLFLLLGGGLLILTTPKWFPSVFINLHHTAFWDVFFKYYTNVGDGLFVCACLVPLAIFRLRYCAFTLVSFLASGGLAQVAKKIYDVPRPKAYFSNLAVHYVPGISIYSNHSFPSGHTTTAFCFFLYLSFLSRSRPLGLFYFACAVLVGISRIYLFQHFFVDVYVGSIIGSGTAILLAYFTANGRKLISRRFDRPLFPGLMPKSRCESSMPARDLPG